MTKRTYDETILTEYELCYGNASQIFDVEFKDSPVIIMVGAHDGVNGEQYGFMKFLDELPNFKLFLIEPVKMFYDQLEEVYGKFGEKVVYLNYAITKINGRIQMIDQGVMSKVGNGSLLVDSKTWDYFILENKISKIDMLLIDCEGYEFHILEQIDYTKCAPVSIRYEHYWLSNKEEADNFLISKGYSTDLCLADPTYNKVCIKK